MSKIISNLNPSYLFWIGLTAFITHGLLILNDGVYWDDWYVYLPELENNAIGHKNQIAGYGLYIQYYLYLAITWLPGIIFTNKLIGFLSISLTAIAIYKIMELTRLTRRHESLWVALLSMTYPVFQISFMMIGVYQLLYYMVFIMAIWVALLSKQTEKPLIHYLLRGGAIALFLFSFSFNILIGLYGGAFFILFIYDWNHSSNKFSLQALIHSLLKNLDYLVLSIVFYVVLRPILLITTTEQPTSGYTPSVSNISISGLQVILEEVVFKQIFPNIERLITNPFLLLFTAIIVIGVLISHSEQTQKSIDDVRIPYYFSGVIILIGIIWFIVGSIPLLLTLNLPKASGWESRQGIFASLPVALIFVSLLKVVFWDRAHTAWHRIGHAIAMIFLLAFSASTISYYIGGQARWVKDRSFIHHMNMASIPQEMNVFWYNDLLYPPLALERYRDEEIGLLLQLADVSYIYTSTFRGIDIFEEYEFVSSTFRTIDDPLIQNSCQALLTITRGEQNDSDIKLTTEYFYYRFFAPSELDNFLNHVSTLYVTPLAVPQNSTCRTQPSSPIVFNPKTSGDQSSGYLLMDVVASVYDHNAEYNHNERLVLEQVVYEPDLLAWGVSADVLAQWRSTKDATWLRDAGIMYLLIDNEWVGYLSEQDYQKIFNNPDYQLLQTWEITERGITYWLFEAQ